MSLKLFLSTSLVLFITFISVLESNAQDGAKLFKANCTACHQLGARLVGPDLLGVSEKRTEEWLIKFIQSSQGLIASGDADAKAIFEEFYSIAMPDQAFSTGEIKSILAYIGEMTPKPSGESDTQTSEPIEGKIEVAYTYTPEDAELGRKLFSGESSLANGGPSCLSCHNVTNNNLMIGGLLAKDLTNVFSRMGHAGVRGILNAPPFPAMNESYNNNEITEEEIILITSFLAEADKVSDTQTADDGFMLYLKGGIGGLILILIIVGILWNGRKKDIVNKRIFERQIKARDAKF